MLLWKRYFVQACSLRPSSTHYGVQPPSLVCGGGLIFPFVQVGGRGSGVVGPPGSRALVKNTTIESLFIRHSHYPQYSRLYRYINNSHS